MKNQEKIQPNGVNEGFVAGNMFLCKDADKLANVIVKIIKKITAVLFKPFLFEHKSKSFSKEKSVKEKQNWEM